MKAQLCWWQVCHFSCWGNHVRKIQLETSAATGVFSSPSWITSKECKEVVLVPLGVQWLLLPFLLDVSFLVSYQIEDDTFAFEHHVIGLWPFLTPAWLLSFQYRRSLANTECCLGMCSFLSELIRYWSIQYWCLAAYSAILSLLTTRATCKFLSSFVVPAEPLRLTSLN